MRGSEANAESRCQQLPVCAVPQRAGGGEQAQGSAAEVVAFPGMAVGDAIGTEKAARKVAGGCALGVSIERAEPENKLSALVSRDAAIARGSAMQRMPEAQRGSHPPGRQVIERDEHAERRARRQITDQPDR